VTAKELKGYDLASEQADYPEWTVPEPKVSLLICTHMRCGSTLLGEFLYWSKNVGCALEYFHAGFRPSFERRWSPRDLQHYREILLRKRTDPSGVFACKLFWRDLLELHNELCATSFVPVDTQLQPPAVLQQLSSLCLKLFPNPTFVRLSRLDQIRQAISLSVARQTKTFRVLDETSRPDLSQVEYRFEEILRFLAECKATQDNWLAFFDLLGLTPLRVDYESLLAQPSVHVNQIRQLLHRPSVELQAPRLQRQSTQLSEEFYLRFLKDARKRTHEVRAAMLEDASQIV
jgi:LPS sulfotransferase NodH